MTDDNKMIPGAIYIGPLRTEARDDLIRHLRENPPSIVLADDRAEVSRLRALLAAAEARETERVAYLSKRSDDAYARAAAAEAERDQAVEAIKEALKMKAEALEVAQGHLNGQLQLQDTVIGLHAAIDCRVKERDAAIARAEAAETRAKEAEEALREMLGTLVGEDVPDERLSVVELRARRALSSSLEKT